MLKDIIARHKKLITYVVGIVVVVLTYVAGPDAPIVLGIELIATGYGVYRAPNRPA